MKNPLVDALRQANTEAESDSHTGVDEEQSVAASHAELSLDLAVSVVLPEPVARGDEESVKGDSGAVVLSVESKPVGAIPLNDETRLMPVLCEQSLAELTGREPSSEVVINAVGGGEAQRGRHWLVRLGIWSPAIALLTLSTAAGAYALYQHLTVQDLNYDLSELSLRSGNDVRDPMVKRGWSDLPENNVHFDTGGYVQLEKIAAPGRTAATAASKVEPGRAVTFEHVPVAESTVERLSIKDPAFAHVQSGFAAYQSGDYERAAVHYRDAVAVDANHRYALAGLAAALQHIADPDEWLPIYQKLLVLNPKDTVAASMVLMHEMSGDPQHRITRLKVLLQRYPEAAELHLALGLLAGDGGQWAEARLAFLNAHRIAPGNAYYSFNAAVSMEHLGQYDQARSYYRLASVSAGQSPLIDQELIAQQLRILAGNAGEPL